MCAGVRATQVALRAPIKHSCGPSVNDQLKKDEGVDSEGSAGALRQVIINAKGLRFAWTYLRSSPCRDFIEMRCDCDKR